MDLDAAATAAAAASGSSAIYGTPPYVHTPTLRSFGPAELAMQCLGPAASGMFLIRPHAISRGVAGFKPSIRIRAKQIAA